MTERPILFTGDMALAILCGHKTQTRRIVKPRHLPFVTDLLGNYLAGKWDERPLPYGKPGDLLWVKETYMETADRETLRPTGEFLYRAGYTGEEPVRLDDSGHVAYRKDGGQCSAWKNPRFMPRRAARILLRVVGIGVERLHDISDEDARAEGMEAFRHWFDDERTDPIGYLVNKEPRKRPSLSTLGYVDEVYDAFYYKWEGINGKGSWAINPWVWVVAFERVDS